MTEYFTDFQRKVFVNQLKGAAKKTHAKGSEKPQKRSITVRKAVPEDRSASLTKKKVCVTTIPVKLLLIQ